MTFVIFFFYLSELVVRDKGELSIPYLHSTALETWTWLLVRKENPIVACCVSKILRTALWKPIVKRFVHLFLKGTRTLTEKIKLATNANPMVKSTVASRLFNSRSAWWFETESIVGSRKIFILSNVWKSAANGDRRLLSLWRINLAAQSPRGVTVVATVLNPSNFPIEQRMIVIFLYFKHYGGDGRGPMIV